ncbi:MAG: EamA family transporter RarD [Anaerovoracaceae bacterium]|nr:EamA family transporter RarD [Anaerovoracaceae bacterium]
MTDKLQHRQRKEYTEGLICTLLSMLMWGILPVYWKSLQPIDPVLIMFYRLVLACLLVFTADIFVFGWKAMWEPLKKKGAAGTYFSAGLVISMNWGIYIYMVNSEYVIQTSIGYYIEPLILCLFGIVFFKEKLTGYKTAAILLACAGAGVMLFSFGQFPFLAFGLAITFSTYAGIKKKVHAPALLSLLYETILLLPIVIPGILYFELNGKGAFAAAEPHQLGLLAFSGLFTAVPLCLFAMGTNRISLIAIGLIEYVSPSITLLLGIFLFREAFDIYQFIGFMIIWIGLAIFTVGSIRDQRQPKEEKSSGNLT